jgi:protoheme IX farnesyltransferase
MIKTYYHLTKPGLVRGNVFSGVAGFFVGSLNGSLDLWLLCAMTAGLTLVISSGCALNNYFDREMDAKMERTKKRALPAGLLTNRQVIMFGIVLGILGAAILYFFTNSLALGAAALGWVVYVWLYTPLKSHTPYALFAGAVAGAMPVVTGYTAAAGAVDVYAATLFVAMFGWQIPHFLAIAYFRYSEYKAGGVPLFITKEPSDDAKRRARKVFRYTLVVLFVTCLGLILQRWIR